MLLIKRKYRRLVHTTAVAVFAFMLIGPGVVAQTSDSEFQVDNLVRIFCHRPADGFIKPSVILVDQLSGRAVVGFDSEKILSLSGEELIEFDGDDGVSVNARIRLFADTELAEIDIPSINQLALESADYEFVEEMFQYKGNYVIRRNEPKTDPFAFKAVYDAADSTFFGSRSNDDQQVILSGGYSCLPPFLMPNKG